MLTEKQIIFSYSNLREKPHSKSNLETQCLFGEKVFILKQEKKWSFVETQVDKYKGWIKNKTLGNTFESNFFLNDLNTIVYESPDLKSKLLFNLFLGSKVNLSKASIEWYRIKINNKKYGYISKSNNFLKINTISDNWYNTVKLFQQSPYLLGGKTCMGIDCSGLVQIILESLNIFIPRNTKDQINFVSNKIFNAEEITKGSLVYWPGHVAIALSNDTIIHSNAFHMRVSIENFREVNKRISKQYGPLLKIKKFMF